MKSTDVYSEINKIMYPELKLRGFKKTKSGMLGFYKQLKEFYLVIWFQCSREGFDQFAGSAFTIEIQISKTNEIGAASIVRKRLPFFLTESDFVDIAGVENQIKDTLQIPPKTYYIFSLAENIQSWYRKKFEKTNTTYTHSSDIWFIYFDPSDIEKWMNIISPILHKVIDDFEQSDY